MSNTLRKYKGFGPFKEKRRSWDDKGKGERKSFVYRGDLWATVAYGGPGNKSGWNYFKRRGYTSKYRLSILKSREIN